MIKYIIDEIIQSRVWFIVFIKIVIVALAFQYHDNKLFNWEENLSS